MKRFYLKCGVTTLLAAFAATAVMGCTNNGSHNKDWCERNRENLTRGQELASQAPCSAGCKHGCQKGPGCNEHQPPAPQQPEVIRQPCAQNESVHIEGLERSKVVGVDLGGVINVTDWVSNCDGTGKVTGTPMDLPVQGTVSMLVTTRVGPVWIPISLTARPGEPCPPQPVKQP